MLGFIYSVLYYGVISVALISVLSLLAAEYLGRRFTCVYDVKRLAKERPKGEKAPNAIVLGGGLAGLMAARVLLDHFEHVTIIENSEYDKPEERVRGAVPQGAHAHILLAIGNATLQALFKGIEEIYKARGGRVQDLGTAMRWFYWASFRVRCQMDFPFWCSTRPFLDKLVRDVFFQQYGSRVTVRSSVKITAPVFSTDLPDIHGKEGAFSNVKVKGQYSGTVPSRDSNEFRIVGVRIKPRGAGGAAAAEKDYDAGIASADVKESTATAQGGPATVFTIRDDDDALAVRVAKSNKDKANLSIKERIAACQYITKRIEDYAADGKSGKDMSTTDPDEVFLGDLVFDATGSNCISEKWAKQWGLKVPTSEIRASSMYVSHLFEEPEGFDADWICAAVYPTPGYSSRFGYLMRVENGMWQVTGMATAGTTVDNSSVEGLIDHFSKLDDPFIYNILTRPNPVTGKAPRPVPGEKLHTYYPKAYVRRHYELAPNWPEGLVAGGNSACVFDPMYGQGMSGAAIAVLSLNYTLQMKQYQGASGLCANGFARTYHSILADRLFFPWTLCVGEDSRWAPKITSSGPEAPEELKPFTRALKFWIRQGMCLAHQYPLAQQTAMGIMNMTVSFTSLLYPPLVYLVFKNIFLETFGLIETPEQRFEKITATKKKLGGDLEYANFVYKSQQTA